MRDSNRPEVLFESLHKANSLDSLTEVLIATTKFVQIFTIKLGES